MFQAFAQRLYLRIWLAVVGGVAVLTLLVGLAWKVAQEHEVRNSVQGTFGPRADRHRCQRGRGAARQL